MEHDITLNQSANEDDERNELLAQAYAEKKKAFKLLRSRLRLAYVPNKFLCRQEQTQKISSFIQSCEQSLSGGIKLVIGVPGTGKTVSILATIRDLCTMYSNMPSNSNKKKSTVHFLEFNAARIPDPEQIYVSLFTFIQETEQYYTENFHPFESRGSGWGIIESSGIFHQLSNIDLDNTNNTLISPSRAFRSPQFFSPHQNQTSPIQQLILSPQRAISFDNIITPKQALQQLTAVFQPEAAAPGYTFTRSTNEPVLLVVLIDEVDYFNRDKGKELATLIQWADSTSTQIPSIKGIRGTKLNITRPYRLCLIMVANDLAMENQIEHKCGRTIHSNE